MDKLPVDTKEQNTTIRPVDWGVSFALSHQKLLLSLALLPALGEIVIAYIRFSYPMSGQAEFLSSVSATALNAWLLTAVSMACITSARGEILKVAQLYSRSIKGLPKVFFSFLGLNLLFVLFALLPPLLFVLILFLWAPLFCVGEQYVKEPDIEEDDSDDYEDEDDIYVRKNATPKAPSFFKNKSILELGFARAAQLGIRNVSSALQIGLLIWCAKFLPFSIVAVLFPESTSFMVELLIIGLSAWTDALVIAITAGTFIFLLSRESQDEIGLLEDENELKRIAGKKRMRVQGSFWATAIFAVLALGSTALVFYQLKNADVIPSHLSVELRSTEIRNKNFNVKLFLNDYQDRFRWFDVQQIKISFPQREGIGLAMEADLEKETEMYPLKTFNVTTPDGRVILDSNFTPIDGPLTVSLTFEVPESVPEKGQFLLYYSTLFREPAMLLEGRYGAW